MAKRPPITIDAPPAAPAEPQITYRPSKPTTYSTELAREFCASVAEGYSIRTTCRRTDMPSMATVQRWRGESDKIEFHKLLEESLRLNALCKVEEVIDIADEIADETSMVKVIAAEKRIRTRMWVAERMLPSIYGRRVEVKSTVEHTHKSELIENILKLVGKSPEPKQIEAKKVEEIQDGEFRDSATAGSAGDDGGGSKH